MRYFSSFQLPTFCLAVLCTALGARRAHADEVVPPQLIEQPVAPWPGGKPLDHDVEVPVVLTVGEEGSVQNVEVESSPGPEYTAAAIVAASRWKLHPAYLNGVATVARVRGVVRFLVNPPPPRPPEPVDTASMPSQAQAPASSQAAASEPAPVPVDASQQPQAPAPVEPVEVVVAGHSQPPIRGASDYTIPVGELSRVPRKNAAEMLKLAPGVHLVKEGGEGHAERVYLRGFDAREGQDIELSWGGVPINESGNLHGNGAADLNFIIPELVLSLRVLEGPFDPRQGNYAVAGSADFEPGLSQRGLTGKYTFGSFGSERLLFTWGPPDESVHTFGGAEIYSTDGFGMNRDARRASAMGQYEGRLQSGATWRINGTAYANEYHSAGLLRAEDVASGQVGFFDTYDTRQGGGGTRFQIAADVEAKSGDFIFFQQLFAIRRGQRLRENYTGFLLDVQQPEQTLHGQRGDLLDVDMDESTLGMRGWTRTSGLALGQKQELELGYFARGDDVKGSRQRIDDATGAPYVTETQLDSRLADLGLYGDATLRFVKWLSLRGGVRADLFAYTVNDRCAVQSVSRPSPDNPPGDDSCLSQQRFGTHREPNQRSSTASTKLMPRASLIAGSFDGFSFSLSYGLGVRSIGPNYISQDVATPFASIEAMEGGVIYAKSFDDLGVNARSVFFRTHVDRDSIFSETEGRATLGGGTTRTGWSGAARLTNDFLDENATITLVRSSFDEDGLLVPYVPDLVIRSDTALFADLPFTIATTTPRGSLAAGVSYVGRKALPYNQRSDTQFTIDTSAAIRVRGYELELQVLNLLDTQYRIAEYNYVSNFDSDSPPTLVAARHFAAGAPRTVFLSFSANFGGV
jgi:hypothetical protein